MIAPAYAFDLYGTLVDYGSLRARLVANAGAKADFIDHWRAKQLQYTFLATMMERYVDFDEITARSLDYVAAQHGVKFTPQARSETIDAWAHLPAFPEVPEVLRALRARGARLAVLSNGTPPALARTVAAAGIADAFDALLSVDSVRVYKPRPNVYELAVGFFKLPRERIGFVSSNGWDAMGAAEFGFDVTWCNRSDAPLETLASAPARTIEHLSKLLD